MIVMKIYTVTLPDFRGEKYKKCDNIPVKKEKSVNASCRKLANACCCKKLI